MDLVNEDTGQFSCRLQLNFFRFYHYDKAGSARQTIRKTRMFAFFFKSQELEYKSPPIIVHNSSRHKDTLNATAIQTSVIPFSESNLIGLLNLYQSN